MTVTIAQQLQQLRRRIRAYVWVEGLAVALAWLCLTFWIGLALDYLPARLGGSEMPTVPRLVLLLLISAGLFLIGYRWIVRRAFVPLRDESLALLIERAHPQLEEGLVTAVELADQADDARASEVQRALYAQTVTSTSGRMGGLSLGRVFDFRPLWRAALLAALLLLSVFTLAVMSREFFVLAAKRLYALSPTAYPRQTLLEMVGWAEQVTIPRGSDFTLRVRADAARRRPPPEVCTVYYKTDDGERGQVNMTSIGQPRDGFQYYAYEGKPFQGVLSDIRFDVVGNDFRIKDQWVHTTDRPQMASMKVAVQLPAYTGLLPRVEVYRPGVQVPQGSSLVFTGQTTKPMSEVTIQDVAHGEPVSLDASPPRDGTQFSYRQDEVMESLVHEITLLDNQGISNEKPYRVEIAVVPDLPPKINSRMVGIGSAVTVDARIPLVVDMSDDFGIAQAWTELQAAGAESRRIPLVPDPDGEVETAIDLRALARDAQQPVQLQPDTKMTLTVMALDACDLGQGAHLGQGATTELEVVTQQRLMALLEVRELGLRRRLEQVITEARETRDSLARVHLDSSPDEAGEPSGDPESEEGESPSPVGPLDEGDDDVDLVERVAAGEDVSQQDRARALRLLRVQRAKQHVERAAAEVLGIALSFDDIRLELINNRVDSAERQRRIEHDIALPLKAQAEAPMPALAVRLGELEGALNEAGAASVLKRAALEELDQVILALEQVLEKMLDLETFSELMDLVNSLIREQEALLEQTKKEREKGALELLK